MAVVSGKLALFRRQHKHLLTGAVSTINSSRNKGRGRASSGWTPVCAGRDVDFADRAVASLPYLVPLFDGLKYGGSPAFSLCMRTKGLGIAVCIVHAQILYYTS